MFLNYTKKQVLQLCCSRIPQREAFVFVDIGAAEGIPRKWSSIAEHLKIVAFEPDSRATVPGIHNDRFVVIPAPLSKESKDLKFYLAKGFGKSSLYRPNMAFLSQFVDSERFEVVKEIIFPAAQVLTLDRAFETVQCPAADFIKLDTQGSELDILEGGQKALSGVFGVQVEVEFAPLYEKQPLFRDVDSFMNDHGFQLMDLRRSYWKRKAHCQFIGKGQLIFADALYSRSLESFADMLSKIRGTASVVPKIYKCVLTCLIYEMYDYAIAVLNYAGKKGYIENSESQEFIKAIMSLNSRDLISFCLPSAYLRNKLYRLCQKVKPLSYLGWADSDIEIANVKDI